MNITFTDRYQALGIPYPELETICHGYCEGTGYVPIRGDQAQSASDLQIIETEEELVRHFEFQSLWSVEHDLNCNLWGVIANLWKHREIWYWRSVFRDIVRLVRGKGYCDGWHFVKCPDCHGTGKRSISPAPDSNSDRGKDDSDVNEQAASVA